MPPFPRRSAHAERIRQQTFEAFAQKLKARAGDPALVPLHLGDTYPLPPEAARRVSLEDPALHRYGPVTGDPALRAAGAADLAALGLPCKADEVFVTPGATGGLDLALDATLEPGDEVLVLTPTWPLLIGLLQRRGALPVEVDVDPGGWLPDDPTPLLAALSAALGPRTVGLSLCDPNNPSGFVYGPAHLAALAELARARSLWVYYDAVYCDLIFAEPPRPLAKLSEVPGLLERAFVATSYSKSFGLAGQRTGLLVPPPAARHLLPRLLTHSTYHASNLGQAMARAALADDPGAARALRRGIARAGARLLRERLGDVLPFHDPAAGAFALLDLRGHARDDAAALALLERCLDAGVVLAPGSAFGSRFGRFARLCTTAVPAERLEQGLATLRRVLGAAG